MHYVKSENGRIYETNDPTIWTGGKFLKGEQLPKAQGKRLYQEQAQDSLRKILNQGETVYCVLRHVSASGMSRTIDFYVIKENRPVWLTGYIGAALDYKRGKHDRGLVISGCGTDMGFHVVYSLARTLWPDQNDNRADRDGGYLLKSEWM